MTLLPESFTHVAPLPELIRPDAEALRYIPAGFAFRHSVLAYAVNGSELVVAVPDRETSTVDRIRLLTGMRVRAIPLERERIRKQLLSAYSTDAREHSAEEIDTASPAVQIVDEIQTAAVRSAASDIHIEPFQAGGRVRQRIDGRLRIALVTNGRAQILATPRLVTLNGREADLLIGQTYPIVYTTSVLGGSNVQFVDIGVKLRLTPTIGPGGSVTAELHPEYSELQGFTSAGYPIIANRKIDSTLRVGDGQTIVLGGLLRDASSQTITRVPWLSEIPLLGRLFADRQSSRERDEIVFLITPHIINSNALPTQ